MNTTFQGKFVQYTLLKNNVTYIAIRNLAFLNRNQCLKKKILLSLVTHLKTTTSPFSKQYGNKFCRNVSHEVPNMHNHEKKVLFHLFLYMLPLGVLQCLF